MHMIEVLCHGLSKRSGPTMVGPGSMKETNVQVYRCTRVRINVTWVRKEKILIDKNVW
jgi:hypothetical protein